MGTPSSLGGREGGQASASQTQIGRQALEYTYAEIATQVLVDEKTIRNVFDEYVAELEKQFKRETPIWLGI